MIDSSEHRIRYVYIYVTANQKRDKFAGVLFGDTLEETCQRALKRVNNHPRVNIVIPVVNKQEITIKDPTVPMAEYTSLYESVEFRTNGVIEFTALTMDLETFICEKGVLRIEELLRRGYRVDNEETRIHNITVFNRISVEMFKEENGTKTKIGYGYAVLENKNHVTYSINYKELLENLGYVQVYPSLVFINTNIESEIKTITLSKIEVLNLGKLYKSIDNIKIGEIREKTEKTGLNISYDDVNRIVWFKIGNLVKGS